MEEPFTMDALHRKDSWKFKLFSSKLELWAKSDTVHFMSVFHVPLGSTCVVSMTQTKDNEWMMQLHRQGANDPENLTNLQRAVLCKVRPVRN